MTVPAVGPRVMPGWSVSTDVVVVGTGVAGLTCALDLAEGGARVLMVTKAGLTEGSTRWAQGGVADPAEGDDLAGHIRDTLVAGAGLSDPEVTARILGAGRAALQRLIARGARFDPAIPGRYGWPTAPESLARTLEGGHRRARIIHAGGDATGSEIERALVSQTGLPAVLVDHQVVDLLLDRTGAVGGLSILDADGVPGEILAGAVVLATGGSSQLYASGTNPEVSTGDGQAMALRAGAELVDVEFVQFHPTALWTPGARGRRPLVTEALRGAGAVLVDGAGAPVMAGVHPLGDLAPRDVVSLAITRRLERRPGGIADHVFLDAGSVEGFAERFPTVAAACREIGAENTAIPVSPAAHYHCGGIAVDAQGRTSVAGLWAIGEVAGTGLHGANRLASNSLLEGLVGGQVAAATLLRSVPTSAPGATELAPPATLWIGAGRRRVIQDAMTAWVGIGRTATGLTAAALEVAGGPVVGCPVTGARPGAVVPDRASVEVTNMMTTASAVIAAAMARTESRGCHVRLDHPEQLPPQRFRVRWSAGGARVRTFTGPVARMSTGVGVRG